MIFTPVSICCLCFYVLTSGVITVVTEMQIYIAFNLVQTTTSLGEEGAWRMQLALTFTFTFHWTSELFYLKRKSVKDFLCSLTNMYRSLDQSDCRVQTKLWYEALDIFWTLGGLCGLSFSGLSKKRNVSFAVKSLVLISQSTVVNICLIVKIHSTVDSTSRLSVHLYICFCRFLSFSFLLSFLPFSETRSSSTYTWSVSGQTWGKLLKIRVFHICNIIWHFL